MSSRERAHDAELKVADYVRRTGLQLIDMPLHEIAQKCGVSDATVVRFCRREGYKGLKDYKIALSRQMENVHYEPLKGNESTHAIRTQLIDGSIQALRKTGQQLNLKALEDAASAIRLSGSLDIYAAGGSVPIASYLRHQLIKLGIRASIYADPSSIRLSYAGFSQYATVLSISASGETHDVLEAQRAAQKAGCITICLTAHVESPLALASQIVLETAGDYFLQNSSYARISQLVAVDMLFAVIYNMQQTK